MVDLEYLEISGERGAPQGEAVHAGADDHVLADAARDRSSQEVFCIAGAKNDCPVAWMRP